MTTPHPYAYALEWIKEGKLDRVVCRHLSWNEKIWFKAKIYTHSLVIGEDGFEFRLRTEPKKYKLVNGVRVPMHEEVEPAAGAVIYVACPRDTQGVYESQFGIHRSHLDWIEFGYIYLNPKDAAECGMAMRKWEACE